MLSTGDAAHDAALLASTRTMGYQVLIDWPHGGTDGDYGSPIQDVTAAVVSLELDRALTTTLPAEVRLAEGVTAAQLTIVLGGQDTPALVGSDGVSRAIIALFNPYNTGSEFYRDNLLGRDVKMYAGAAGFTPLQLFTGRIRKVEPSPANGTVTITVLDYTELLRVPADLPVVQGIAELTTYHDVRKPGLNASWAVNYLARRCGYYTSPKRTHVLVEASMRGSAWPETGDVFNMAYNPYGLPDATDQLDFVANGPHGQALLLSDGVLLDNGGREGQSSYSMPAQPMTSGAIHMEAWVRAGMPAAGGATDWDIHVTGNLWGPGAEPSTSFPMLMLNNNSTVLQVDYWRDLSTGVVAHVDIAGGWPDDQNWHYVGVRGTFSGTTSTSQVSVVARVDGTSYGPYTLNPASGTPTAATSFYEAAVVGYDGRYAEISDFCVTSETGTPTWSNAFVQTAVIEQSALDLTTIPPVARQDAYTTIQEIAGAEAAAAGFDETGTFYYRPRAHFESTAGYASVRVIDADSALIDLATATAIDSVRNDIRVPVQPYAVSLFMPVWEATEVIRLDPGMRSSLTVNLTDPVFDIADPVYGNKPWDITPTGPAISGYFANTKSDGSGRQLGSALFSITVTSDGMTIVITNRHRARLYLVYPKGTLDGSGTDVGGQPSLWIGGRKATAGTPTAAREYDATASLYQIYEAPTSVWRQTTTVATSLAVDLLGDLGAPRPQFLDVPIIGDPRLQIGDVVTLTDPYRLNIAEEARIIGIRTTAGAGQFSQTLTARALYTPGQLILNRTGRDELDAGWVLG